MENLHIDNYITVKGTSLRDVNAETKRIWYKALLSGYNEIITLPKHPQYDKEEEYLIDCNIYFNLVNAARITEKGIDPYGIPNVNFTLIAETDDRWSKYQKQRLERGFDNSETWSLDSTISRFVEPRLKVFKEIHCGHPSGITSEEWDEILDKMILSFELINNDELKKDLEIKEREKLIDEGMDLFRKYFFHLWW